MIDLGASPPDRPAGGESGYVAVTFVVDEWFRGGASREVTVDMASPTASSYETSVAGGTYGVGSRLLVSGEPRWGGHSSLQGAVAWGCGFTRHYDLATADSWRQAAANETPLRGPRSGDAVPAESKLPAAGVCASASGEVVTVELNPDTPSPRCTYVRANQLLRVVNTSDRFGQAGAAITVEFADFPARLLQVGEATVFNRPFGGYLAVGVHSLTASNYAGGGAELWLRRQAAPRVVFQD